MNSWISSPKDMPSRPVVAGNPAMILRYLETNVEGKNVL